MTGILFAPAEAQRAQCINGVWDSGVFVTDGSGCIYGCFVVGVYFSRRGAETQSMMGSVGHRSVSYGWVGLHLWVFCLLSQRRGGKELKIISYKFA